MQIDGQGDTAPESIDDLADFLVDNPGADEQEELTPNADEPDESENSDDDNPEDAPADDEDDESDSEDAKEPTSDLKFKITVKGEDGTDSTVEVDQKELIAGYQRHSDYTRKSMALADREREAFTVVTAEIEKSKTHYMEQAQLAHAAVRQLAGLRNPQQMAQLAQEDPAAWVQESQRAAYIQGVLQDLENGVSQERSQTQQQQKAQQAKTYERTWSELSKDGIDKPALAKIYSTMSAKYGVSAERLAGVDNPVVVRIMRDAAAYAELKDRKAAVVKKVAEAPKLPAARQNVPKNEQRTKAINQRFSNGRAKLGDLAAYLENS